MNSNSLGVINEYSIYVPTNYLNYKFALSINSDYVDLFDVPILESGQTYSYIRVFLNKPGLLDYKVYDGTLNTVSVSLSQVNLSDDFFARSDAFSICGMTLCLMLILIWVFNSLTEFFNKGGLFHI